MSFCDEVGKSIVLIMINIYAKSVVIYIYTLLQKNIKFFFSSADNVDFFYDASYSKIIYMIIVLIFLLTIFN